MKYQSLINILDRIRNEAPSRFKRYYPKQGDTEKLNQARSWALIHLYLKVKFGLTDFEERQYYITDGSYDGGIDGYYINEEEKIVYWIQSKFRTSSENFENKKMDFSEILSMDVGEISEGNEKNENGQEYNGKVKQLIRDINNVPDIGKYKDQVVLLANVKEIRQSKLKQLTGGFPCEVFDFRRSYSELVYPVVSGTYYNLSELRINISLNNKGSGSMVSYKVATEFRECNISVLFVPTSEIARIMSKYKNSILKYNPRSYLDLSNNTVNQAIRDTIITRKTNEFALFNNGITILSDETHYRENVGSKNLAQLILTNGQIINGGQTAYTLSLIYESQIKKGKNPLKLMGSKEVLLKVITFEDDDGNDPKKKLSLIEAISKATNQQTTVNEADRRSNDKIQIELQERIFDEFGYYYERKRGEFGDGIRNKYIDKSMIISRDHFIRLCLSFDRKPSLTRRSSESNLFKESNFTRILNDADRYREYFFAYCCFERLSEIQASIASETHNNYDRLNYGNALRYGRYAVTSVAANLFKKNLKTEEFQSHAKLAVDNALDQWLAFEKGIESHEHNAKYFNRIVDEESDVVRLEMNYTGYYKGTTMDEDLLEYFN